MSWQIIIRCSGDKREWEAKNTFFCKLVKNLNSKLLYLRAYNTHHKICIIIFFPSLFYEWIKHRVVIYGECAHRRGTNDWICSKMSTFKITVLKYHIYRQAAQLTGLSASAPDLHWLEQLHFWYNIHELTVSWIDITYYYSLIYSKLWFLPRKIS